MVYPLEKIKSHNNICLLKKYLFIFFNKTDKFECKYCQISFLFLFDNSIFLFIFLYNIKENQPCFNLLRFFWVCVFYLSRNILMDMKFDLLLLSITRSQDKLILIHKWVAKPVLWWDNLLMLTFRYRRLLYYIQLLSVVTEKYSC